ncbi:hypothetical protein CALVIDRAFT_565294 [Calocera viscosa TUFC12733]|uniref:Checkpoint protein n=1 Tax=Calocera viscosa (strain TUFC12733) TaxID=1330018 RepID=A0A167KQC6_CALVF|nr:hypothetical protein CALVIDRAFT_565294 [Calocera viscosa TUFC12733]
MDATIEVNRISELVHMLTCLSRYSENVDILGLADSLTFSATNSSLSGYCCLVLERSYFSSYSIRPSGSSVPTGRSPVREARRVQARIKTKILLSRLKMATPPEKKVERIQLVIREYNDEVADGESDDEDGVYESRLFVKLFCQHGVRKTHRLSLDDLDEILAPHLDEDALKHAVIFPAPVMKTLLGRMHVGIQKADGHVTCEFKPASLLVRTVADKGDIFNQLEMDSTELAGYEVTAAPVAFSFHIREFAQLISHIAWESHLLLHSLALAYL